MTYIIMIKKAAVILLAILLLAPLAGTLNGFEKVGGGGGKERGGDDNGKVELREAVWSDWHLGNQLGFYVRTVYNGIEKTTPVIQSIFSGIDIDNDPMTGVDGKDVKVSVFALPLLQPTDDGIVFTLSIAMKVIRLGEETKNGEFEICLGGSIPFNGLHTFRIGYYSANGEEIPKEMREVATIVPYIFYDKDPEFYINAEPVFENGNENVSVILQYSSDAFGEHRVTIDYFPAVNTMIKFSPSLSMNKFGISIERFADIEQTIRIGYAGDFEATLTIEDIPQQMAFTMSFSDNYFKYEASDEFNASLNIEYKDMDLLARIEYLPHFIAVSFEQEGYLSINTDERKSRFIVTDDLEEPSIYLAITNLSGETIIRWDADFDAYGFMTIDGFSGLKVEMKANAGNMHFDYYATIKTEHFELRWNLSVPGSIYIDSNNEWLASYYLNFTMDDMFGILIEASMLKANNFALEWQSSVPFFETSGELQFVGEITFAVMINGVWYQVFS